MEEKVVKVGQLPGRLEEYVVRPGTTISEVLNMAGLSPEGKQVKMDEQVVDLNTATVNTETEYILLSEQFKGNF